MNDLKNPGTLHPGMTDSTTDRLANRASDAMQSARSTVEDGLDTLADRASAATDWASDQLDSMGGMSGLARSSAEYVRSYPYVALGAAVLLGFLLGRSARH